MKKVFVLGSINRDIIFNVDTLPSAGMTISSHEMFESLGGKGVNQAYACSWTGADVAMIGALGDDPTGGSFLRAINQYHLKTNYLQTVDYPTGTAVIFVDKKGENLIVVNGGANLHVPLIEIDEIQSGDLVVSQLETNSDAVEHYFSMAKSRCATTILNPSPFKEISKKLFDLTDVFIVNETEASMLLKKDIAHYSDIVDSCDHIASLGIKHMIVTLGKHGAVAISDNNYIKIDGVTSKVVDTQGAGDAFLGVFVGEFAKGASFLTAAEHANKIASMCVEVKGSTIESMPKKEQVI